jgi:hypothetical protein
VTSCRCRHVKLDDDDDEVPVLLVRFRPHGYPFGELLTM